MVFDPTYAGAGSPYNSGNSNGTGLWGSFGSALGQMTGTGSSDPTNAARGQNAQTSTAAYNFGNQANDYYNQGQGAVNANIAALQRQASGQNSLSAMQLQQGLQQNLAAQQAQAASASPQNAAMAARTAAIQSGQLGAGLSGQQATAGLQEQRQAQGQLSDAINQQQQLSSQNALGGWNATNNATNSAIQNPQKTTGQAATGAVGGIAGALTMMSDERLKTNIKGGDAAAAKALSGLRAYSYDYKDEKYGKGKQLGIMAQGLESAGLGHTIIETPAGKAVHGGKLAAALAAMMPGLDDRLSKLEGKGR
jgi:Chaperone of endosialidase